MRKLKRPVDDPFADASIAALQSVIQPPTESSVADVSRKLADTIEQADREERVASARAAVFESANAAKERPMTPPMEAIVRHHFDDPSDMIREHRELEDALNTTDKPGHQVHELERAESRARRAFRLYVRFRQMRFEHEQDNAVLFASMRAEATKSLQLEKKQGYRTKQITDADVEAECARLYQDEYRHQENARSRARLTEKSLEHLVEIWSSKCRSLTALVSKGR